MAVARYRERWTVARSKSDHADVMVLANILRTDRHAHRLLPADSELAQAIAVLARAHQDAVDPRRRRWRAAVGDALTGACGLDVVAVQRHSINKCGRRTMHNYAYASNVVQTDAGQ